MRKIFSNKKLAAVAVAAVAITGTGVAYAYWSTTGSGSGSATNDATADLLTLRASWNADALHPGGDEVVTFYATNPGETDLRVNSVSLRPATAAVVDDPLTTEVDETAPATTPFTTNVPGCNVSDFHLPSVIQDFTVLGHTAAEQQLPETGVISFDNDDDTSQDACKGAIVTAHLVSN